MKPVSKCSGRINPNIIGGAESSRFAEAAFRPVQVCVRLRAVIKIRNLESVNKRVFACLDLPAGKLRGGHLLRLELFGNGSRFIQNIKRVFDDKKYRLKNSEQARKRLQIRIAKRKINPRDLEIRNVRFDLVKAERLADFV